MKTNLRMKSLLAVTLAIIVIFGVLVPSFADTNPFVDVADGAWYYDAVMYCKGSGLFNGTSSNTFSPNDTMTRAMFVTVLGRYEGIDKTQYTAPTTFGDVVADSWYGPYVKWANENKIVDGYSATRFGPDDALTREQMVTLFYRYANFKGYNTAVEGEPGRNFSDYSATSNFARNAINWAVSRKLIAGTHKGLEPKAITSRAQVAQVLYNISRAAIMTTDSEQLVFENQATEPIPEPTPTPTPEPVEEPDPTPTPEPSPVTPIWKVGDIVTMGTYEQDHFRLSNGNVNWDAGFQVKPIEWIVISITDGKALLLSKNSILSTEYGNPNTSKVVCWATSFTRKLLNEDFYNTAFTPEERSRICNTFLRGESFNGSKLPEYETQEAFEADYSIDTYDNVFVLSKSEAMQYVINNPIIKPYASAEMTEYASSKSPMPFIQNNYWWVLRTPTYDPCNLCYVDDNGTLDMRLFLSAGYPKCTGIRPAMWVSVNNAITCSTSAVTIECNESTKLTVHNAATNSVKWTSSDDSIATVSSDGVITAHRGGTCIITAYDGYAKATCHITVPEPIVRTLSIQFVSGPITFSNDTIGLNTEVALAVTCSDPEYDLSGSSWSIRLLDKYVAGPVDPDTGNTTWIAIPNDKAPETTIDNSGILRTGNSPEVINVTVTSGDLEATCTLYVGM